MEEWKQAFKQGAVTGSVASILSTVALAAFGKRENGNIVAPTNAISHWLWGDSALREERATLKHTLVGYLIHHGTSVFWATIYARVYGNRPQAKQPPNALIGGTATAGIACFADYQVTPKRFTPGFEHRLSTPAMAVTYLAFGLGLALASMALKRDR